MTDRATRYLEDKIRGMEENTKQFENAITRRPVTDNRETAEQALERLREKHRQPKPKTDADTAAEFLANYTDGR